MPAKSELISPSNIPEVAVISPCSSCKNNRVDYTPEGYWPCPRKVWENRLKTQVINDAVPVYLPTAGGKDGAYANPCYQEDKKLLLIWTASLVRNSGIYAHGTRDQVTTDILDPQFDTTYIKCNELPSLPMETEASYFNAGAYKQGETVIIFPVEPFQKLNSNEPYLINGFAKRVDLAFRKPFMTHDEDVIISGM